MKAPLMAIHYPKHARLTHKIWFSVIIMVRGGGCIGFSLPFLFLVIIRCFRNINKYKFHFSQRSLFPKGCTHDVYDHSRCNYFRMYWLLLKSKQMKYKDTVNNRCSNDKKYLQKCWHWSTHKKGLLNIWRSDILKSYIQMIHHLFICHIIPPRKCHRIPK